MIALLLPWLKSPNLWAIVAIVGLCVGIYTAGQRSERNKTEAEVAKTNSVIVEARGKDEAELDAEAKAAKTIDDAVKAALNQRFILDEETARLLGSVGK